MSHRFRFGLYAVLGDLRCARVEIIRLRSLNRELLTLIIVKVKGQAKTKCIKLVPARMCMVLRVTRRTRGQSTPVFSQKFPIVSQLGESLFAAVPDPLASDICDI